MGFVNALVIAEMPLGKITLAVFSVLILIFNATTIDSSAFVLASVCAKDMRNDQEPRRWTRVVWAVLLALLTAGILQSGTLDVVQSMSVLGSLPLIPVVFLLCVSLVRWLEEDFGDRVRPKELVLDADSLKADNQTSQR
jgi:BCCT family betaine/carnitine transporter